MTGYMVLSDFTITVFRGIAVVIMLFAMIVLLLGINRLFHSDIDSSRADTERFRHEVDESDNVISSQSVFNEFLTKEVPVSNHSVMERRKRSNQER